MPIRRPFATATLTGGVFLIAARTVPGGAHGSPIWAAIRELPSSVTLPLAVFAGGIASAAHASETASESRRQAATLGVVAGLGVLVGAGFAGPWSGRGSHA